MSHARYHCATPTTKVIVSPICHRYPDLQGCSVLPIYDLRVEAVPSADRPSHSFSCLSQFPRRKSPLPVSPGCHLFTAVAIIPLGALVAAG